jgi:hypothetical protein
MWRRVTASGSGIGRGQCAQWPGVGDSLVRPVGIVELLELAQGVEQMLLVRAENLIRGCDQQSCPPYRLAVMITDHVPAVRLPPDSATTSTGLTGRWTLPRR